MDNGASAPWPYGGWPPVLAPTARAPMERGHEWHPHECLGAHQTGPRPRDRRPSTASAPTEPPPWNVRRATITAWVHSTPRHTPAMTPAPDPEGNTRAIQKNTGTGDRGFLAAPGPAVQDRRHRGRLIRRREGALHRSTRPPSKPPCWSSQPATHALPPKPPRAVARAGGWAIGPTTVPLTSRPLHVAPTSRRPVCVHPLHVDADPPFRATE
jgi:hypothetical protein